MFRPKTKQIVAHANVPKYLKAGYDGQVAKRAQMSPPPTTPAPAKPVAIDKTVADALTLTHGDERISIKHYGAAHTGGDVVIYFERANVAQWATMFAGPPGDRSRERRLHRQLVDGPEETAASSCSTLAIFGDAGPSSG